MKHRVSTKTRLLPVHEATGVATVLRSCIEATVLLTVKWISSSSLVLLGGIRIEYIQDRI